MASTVSHRLQAVGNWFDTIISALVILLALAFLIFLYAQTGTGHFGSYSLIVRLPSAGGLEIGKDVRVGGLKVGSVSRLSLDPRTYSAVVEVSVRDDLPLPMDSTATVSSTVMGEVYLVIAPGHAARTVRAGGTLAAPPTTVRAPVAGT